MGDIQIKLFHYSNQYKAEKAINDFLLQDNIEFVDLKISIEYGRYYLIYRQIDLEWIKAMDVMDKLI